jgi:hypothetical protein
MPIGLFSKVFTFIVIFLSCQSNSNGATIGRSHVEANKITLLIAFMEGESSIIGSCNYIGDLVFGCAV